MPNPAWRVPDAIVPDPQLRGGKWLAARVRELLLKRNRLDIPRPLCEALVEAVVDSLRLAVESGDRVQLRGFGTFQAVWRNARTGRNPIDGSRIPIPRSVKCVFKSPAAWGDQLTLRCGGEVRKPFLEQLARAAFERRKAGVTKRG